MARFPLYTAAAGRLATPRPWGLAGSPPRPAGRLAGWRHRGRRWHGLDTAAALARRKEWRPNGLEPVKSATPDVRLSPLRAAGTPPRAAIRMTTPYVRLCGRKPHVRLCGIFFGML